MLGPRRCPSLPPRTCHPDLAPCRLPGNRHFPTSPSIFRHGHDRCIPASIRPGRNSHPPIIHRLPTDPYWESPAPGGGLTGPFPTYGGAIFAIGGPSRRNALKRRCLQRFGLKSRDRGEGEAPAEPHADGLLTPDPPAMDCGGPTPPWIPAERVTRPTVERPDDDRPGRGQSRPAEPETWNPEPGTRTRGPQIDSRRGGYGVRRPDAALDSRGAGDPPDGGATR